MLLHSHYFRVHYDPEVVPVRILFMGRVDLFQNSYMGILDIMHLCKNNY